jgi:hypothetical protein
MNWKEEIAMALTDSRAALMSEGRREAIEHLKDAVKHFEAAIESLENDE